MKILEDADVRHYILLALLGIGGFCIAAVLLYFMFRANYAIQLSRNVLEYGKTVPIVDLVESIGGVPVESENRISENTIKMEEYEVSFEGYDPNLLGEQSIVAHFSNEEISNQTLMLTIQDTTAPEIRVNVEEPIEMELEDVNNKRFEDYYAVSDNYTGNAKIEVETYIEESSFSYDDDITLIVEANDSNGNRSQKEIQIHIAPEPEPEPESEESREETMINDQSTSTDNSSSGTNSSSTQTPPQSVYKPANRKFLFSDGYNMGNVQSACQNALNASGYSGACIPIQDENGIYQGMDLIFY